MNTAFTQGSGGGQQTHSYCTPVKCLIVEMFSAQPIKDNEEGFDSSKESSFVASYEERY